jgi:hypothetical protein
MADYDVAITWGDVKPGREKKALELWADAVVLIDKAVADGRISSWDAIVLEPTGSPPAGVTRLHGGQDQVEQFIQSDDFQDMLVRDNLLLNNDQPPSVHDRRRPGSNIRSIYKRHRVSVALVANAIAHRA